MKKVLVLLLLFVVTCGGSNKENVAKDTTVNEVKKITTTIKDPVSIDGLTVLYAGHSFGIPFAQNLTKLAEFSV